MTSKNEKGSNTGRDPVASTSKNISRPTSVTSQHSGQLGSVVSIQSKGNERDKRTKRLADRHIYTHTHTHVYVCAHAHRERVVS